MIQYVILRANDDVMSTCIGEVRGLLLARTNKRLEYITLLPYVYNYWDHRQTQFRILHKERRELCKIFLNRCLTVLNI